MHATKHYASDWTYAEDVALVSEAYRAGVRQDASSAYAALLSRARTAWCGADITLTEHRMPTIARLTSRCCAHDSASPALRTDTHTPAYTFRIASTSDRQASAGARTRWSCPRTHGTVPSHPTLMFLRASAQRSRSSTAHCDRAVRHRRWRMCPPPHRVRTMCTMCLPAHVRPSRTRRASPQR